MLYCLPLARGQTRDRASGNAGRVGANKPLCWIGSMISMAFERERRIHLAQFLSTNTAEEINRAPVGDYAQPRGERSVGVVRLSRTVNGQQYILHHVVDAVSYHPSSARNCLDDGYAVSQQCLVSSAIACLSSHHQSG